MYLYWFLNNRNTNTEKAIDVVACPDVKLKLLGLIKVLNKWLILSSLLGLKREKVTRIKLVN